MIQEHFQQIRDTFVNDFTRFQLKHIFDLSILLGYMCRWKRTSIFKSFIDVFFVVLFAVFVENKIPYAMVNFFFNVIYLSIRN